jgi:hypothetical protein
MNESVRVLFPEPRDVFVDGARCGATNDVLTVETGTHTFDLGPDPDYEPRQVQVRVAGTSPLAPKIISFDPVES